MPNRTITCAHTERVQALARGDVPPAEWATLERHLEQCAACRQIYRQETEGRYPRFRNYTILGEVGKGGFGVVYKAVHHGKERIEALKVLFAKTAQREAYFENEVHVVARLNHSHIATLYEAHLQSAPHYYTMEFVDGPNLDEYCQSHQVTLEQRLRIVRAVAEAVAYAHRNGVVHRDLKPQNILMTPAGEPRILDFGIAKRVTPDDEPPAGDGDANHEAAMGTYGYMAPEQVAGQDVDARADVYSLGALLFHLITGEPARFAQQSDRLLATLRARRVSRPRDLAAIVARCTAAVREERYATCDAFAADLENYLQGRAPQARPDATPSVRMRRMMSLMLRNHDWPLLLALGGLATLFLLGVFETLHVRETVPAAATDQVALIHFDPATEAAMHDGRFETELPDLDPANRKSWRVLYGRLMEHLAGSGIRALAWDYFFPDAQPAYDPAFVRGVQALDAPVIVGAVRFDANADPELSPEIRAAVHGWGDLSVKSPAGTLSEVHAVLARQRGYNPLIPSLAVAAFAAARHPDSALDVQVAGRRLVLRYRKQSVGAGEPRWEQPDTIAYFEREEVGGEHEVVGEEGVLVPGDVLYLDRYAFDQVREWRARAVSFADVLAADPEQLRRWFAGRVVMVGEQSLRDLKRTPSGELFYGSQIHTDMAAALLGDTQLRPLDAWALRYRLLAWAMVGLLLMHLPGVRRLADEPGALALAVALGGLGLAAALTTIRVTEPIQVEGAIGVATMLCIAGLTLAVQVLHRRQLRLVPDAGWSVEGTTVASTDVQATGSSSRRQRAPTTTWTPDDRA